MTVFQRTLELDRSVDFLLMHPRDTINIMLEDMAKASIQPETFEKQNADQIMITTRWKESYLDRENLRIRIT